MTTDFRLYKRKGFVSPAPITAEEFLSDFPELAQFSSEIYEAVVGTYRDSPRGPIRSRSKEQISGYFHQAMALYKILKDPRPHHLSHLNGLKLSELEDAAIVRRKLIERIEWSRRILTTRNVVFGHLWKDIAAFATPSSAHSLGIAYPNLIPKVGLIKWSMRLS